jgi:hypothetical protein
MNWKASNAAAVLEEFATRIRRRVIVSIGSDAAPAQRLK